jgi:hypothetical protein
MATPFYTAFDSISTPNGTWIKPGGQVVAYVRSTGVQSGDLSPVADLLVATIAAGVARCRSGMNDIVVVLPGHTETVTTTLFTPVVGAQIVGAGMPGASNAPNVTLSATAATIALSAANMSIIGLNINSATAGVLLGINVTAAGVTLADNFISFTGALGANPLISVTGAANFTMVNNHIVANCTDPIVEVTGAGSSNFVIERNKLRQAQGTSGGVSVSIADTAGISGFACYNLTMTASAQTAPAGGITLAGVTANEVGVFENYTLDTAAGSGYLGPATAT